MYQGNIGCISKATACPKTCILVQLAILNCPQLYRCSPKLSWDRLQLFLLPTDKHYIKLKGMF